MNGNDEFKEFGGLAGKLAKADFTSDSRVKAALRSRLLEKQGAARGRGWQAWRAWWLLPAAAAAGVMMLVVNVGHKRPGPAAAYTAGAGYALPDDGYGACGRRGMGDIMAEERF